MSKELKALNIIGDHKIKYDVNIKYDNGNETQQRFETIRDMFPNEFALIETALKDYEIMCNTEKQVEKEYRRVVESNKVKKKLKALEIIKEKEVDIGWLKRAKDLNQYNMGMGINSYSALTQEEYDLLREVLL